MNEQQDRRKETRLAAEKTVFVEYFADDSDSDSPQIILCSSLDISPRGIQLLIDQPLAAGTVLRVCVDTEERDKPLFLVGEVKWSRPAQDGFSIGFELYDAEQTDIAGWEQLIFNHNPSGPLAD